jgi:NADH:ubiquinone oxidoreductase subunit
MLQRLKHTIQSLLSTSSTLSVRLQIGLAAKHVGDDPLGNRYFVGKPRRGYSRERRFVLYANMKGDRGFDASQVPPEWHGWLHHQTNNVPAATNPLRHAWQLPPQENLTGTSQAYVPPGHTMRGGKRDKATGDYQAWTPHA